MQDTIAVQFPANSQPRKTLLPTFFTTNWDLPVWGLLLLVVNLPLVRGHVNTALLWLPQYAQDGQWWRLITYPLVHLSWYHLILDGSAFLLLYHGMEEKRWSSRAMVLGLCSAGSLWLGYWLGDVRNSGLTGLSGIAHGLMAYTALEMLTSGSRRSRGLFCLVLVVVKSIYELVSGHVVFEFMHLGLCGQPVAASHAGGVLGGVAGFALVQGCRRLKTFHTASQEDALQ